ncbi:Hypothetical protein A7982_11837 [Minicystis rosea]|nr:Hypothetical protein A7982_11837 [Minicystis rosea]
MEREGGDVDRAASACTRADLLVLCVPLATGSSARVLRAAVRVALLHAEREGVAREHVEGLSRAFHAWFEEAGRAEALLEALRVPVLAIVAGDRRDAFLNAIGDLGMAAMFAERGDGSMIALMGNSAMERLGFALADVSFGELDAPAYLRAQAMLAAEIRAHLESPLL